ncbi:inactive transglutaminase family protein [Teredinibacter sp. KSP-S5-2]|uniref:inactive transglutaminase family protein n=1 Tax=Teredinibacter sp. KSP-S5-2 TaxID=3034506 RepID=UPI002934389A|nr:inactive transglutaminase family protein [Teredinibacter sp. KSP-S5-2]WNO09499.1 inactive transglutaminase family protein [Teredinibacter sp. KSP-S5-2]
MKRHSRTPFYLLIALLIVSGLALTWYRHYAFDVPWLPGEKRQVWSIEAKIEFLAQGEPIVASLAIPSSQPGFELMGEHTASPGYGLSFVEKDGGRRAEWSIRNATGLQTLYYRIDMLSLDFEDSPYHPPSPDIRFKLKKEGPYQTAAAQLLARAKERSANAFTLTRELISEFNTQNQTARFLLQEQSRTQWLVELLNLAEIKSREVLVLTLEDGRRRQSLLSYLQVYDGEEYQLFDPRTGKQGQAANQLLWKYHSDSLLDLVGGTQSNVHFSVIEQEVPVSRMLDRDLLSDKPFLDISIHSLPLEEQTLFKGILLVPVGVLVVVFLRILIGLRTSGTFMPVLIAIAFIQTSLLTGLLGFVLVVTAGLVIRSYLSQLNLLLVARISAVIISVIAIIAAFSVLSFQLGLSEGLKITFFPMIILAWTIERMSILWEEEGPQEVLVQVGGSLFVALVAYVLMTNEVVRHLTFNFLGLQLVFMALVLLMGNYTGYRLLEYRRFKTMLK